VASRSLVDHSVFSLSCFPCLARASFEGAGGGGCRSCCAPGRFAASHSTQRVCAAGNANLGGRSDARRLSTLDMKQSHEVGLAIALGLALILFGAFSFFS